MALVYLAGDALETPDRVALHAPWDHTPLGTVGQADLDLARRALGPLASARLRVMLEPRTASVMAPWQSVELETDAAGVVVFALPLEIMCLHVYADGFASVTVTP